MRAVCYARVSSATQRDRDTIASQIRVLPEFVTRQGWELVRPVETYVDDGFSAQAGKLLKRSGFSALLRDAGLKIFDVVVVVDVDRLTRSGDLAERGMILGAFQAAGVKVASVMGGQVLDFATELGDIMGSLQAAFASAADRKRRERSLQGQITAMHRGRKGSGVSPWGLKFDRVTGHWSIDSVAGPAVVEMFERVVAGESCAAIALDFDRRQVPRPRGVWRRNRVYEVIRARYPVGEWVAHHAKHIVVRVPALVSEDLWQRAQEHLIQSKTRGLRRTRHVYLLEDLATCGHCGGPIHIRSGDAASRSRATYVCRDRRTWRHGVERCPSSFVPQREVDARVWAAVCRELEDPHLVEAITAVREQRAADRHDWDGDAAGYEKHIDRLDRAEASILARFRRGLLNERVMDAELVALRRERDAVAAQLQTADKARGAVAASQARLLGAAAMIEEIRAKLPHAGPELRRELVRALVEPGSVEFRGLDVRLTLLVPRGRSALAPVTGPRLDSGHESHLRIRLVA